MAITLCATTGLTHDTHALPRLALGIDGPIIRPIPGTLIATPDSLFPADFFGAVLEVQTFWRVTCDSVENRGDQLGGLQSHRLDGLVDHEFFAS